jgi:hypothetical protein
MGREEPGDSHPIVSEWGGAWVVPEPGEGSSWARTWSIWNAVLSHTFSMSLELSLSLACLIFSLRSFWGWRMGVLFFFWISFGLTRGSRPYQQGEMFSPTSFPGDSFGHKPTSFPGDSFGHKVSELLSSTIKVPHGELGCSWRSHLSVENDSPVVSWFGS